MKISQREARRLKQRVQQLEDDAEARERIWASEWPRGVNVGHLEVPPWLYYSALTARKLGHAIVVTTADQSKLGFHAVKLSK